jgi:hypothetical protein
LLQCLKEVSFCFKPIALQQYHRPRLAPKNRFTSLLLI